MMNDRLSDRFRNRLAIINDWLSKLIATSKSTTQSIGTQRMCPFCSLITPRSRRVCLECGKSFGNA
jgi:hypothetical protein